MSIQLTTIERGQSCPICGCASDCLFRPFDNPRAVAVCAECLPECEPIRLEIETAGTPAPICTPTAPTFTEDGRAVIEFRRPVVIETPDCVIDGIWVSGEIDDTLAILPNDNPRKTLFVRSWLFRYELDENGCHIFTA